MPDLATNPATPSNTHRLCAPRTPHPEAVRGRFSFFYCSIDKDAIAREVELAKKSSRAKPRMLRIGRMPKRLDLP